MTSVDYLYTYLAAALTEQNIKKHTAPEGNVICLSLQPTGVRRTADGKQNFREESVQVDIQRDHIEAIIPEDPPVDFEDLDALQVISEKVKDALLGMHLTAQIVLIQLENETGFTQNGTSQEYFWTGWFRVRLDLSNYT